MGKRTITLSNENGNIENFVVGLYSANILAKDANRTSGESWMSNIFLTGAKGAKHATVSATNQYVVVGTDVLLTGGKIKQDFKLVFDLDIVESLQKILTARFVKSATLLSISQTEEIADSKPMETEFVISVKDGDDVKLSFETRPKLSHEKSTDAVLRSCKETPLALASGVTFNTGIFKTMMRLSKDTNEIVTYDIIENSRIRSIINDGRTLFVATFVRSSCFDDAETCNGKKASETHQDVVAEAIDSYCESYQVDAFGMFQDDVVTAEYGE